MPSGVLAVTAAGHDFGGRAGGENCRRHDRIRDGRRGRNRGRNHRFWAARNWRWSIFVLKIQRIPRSWRTGQRAAIPLERGGPWGPPASGELHRVIQSSVLRLWQSPFGVSGPSRSDLVTKGGLAVKAYHVPINTRHTNLLLYFGGRI